MSAFLSFCEMSWWLPLWPELVAINIINTLLCYTQYIYGFIVSLCFKHNGMSATKICSMEPYSVTILKLNKLSINYHLCLCHVPGILDSSVSIVTVYKAGFEWCQGKEIFLYFKTVTPRQGPTQPSVMKQPGLETDHSSPSAEVKNEWSPYLHSRMRLYVFV